MSGPSTKARHNRTTSLNDSDRGLYESRLLRLTKAADIPSLKGRTIWQDVFDALPHLPNEFVDLLFVDPPYNADKQFNLLSFKRNDDVDYEDWIDSWFVPLLKTLKPTASVYVCADWRSSSAIYRVLSRHLHVRNRITWEREKGRGALSNWKSCSEDIWFATASDDFYFNSDAVKVKRRVVAPYRDSAGRPKDWNQEAEGNFRETFHSNLWTDLTVPFWSMAENTNHPTQKPEKLLAKVVLASSKPDDFVFDPFVGSGTTSVVAQKLQRRFCGIEIDKEYACLAEKRLAMAAESPEIQGYRDGVFWERNTLRPSGRKLVATQPQQFDWGPQ